MSSTIHFSHVLASQPIQTRRVNHCLEMFRLKFLKIGYPKLEIVVFNFVLISHLIEHPKS